MQIKSWPNKSLNRASCKQIGPLSSIAMANYMSQLKNESTHVPNDNFVIGSLSDFKWVKIFQIFTHKIPLGKRQKENRNLDLSESDYHHQVVMTQSIHITVPRRVYLTSITIKGSLLSIICQWDFLSISVTSCIVRAEKEESSYGDTAPLKADQVS